MGILWQAHGMIQLAKVFGHGPCKPLAVGRTKESHLRTHSLMMEASFNSLVKMVLWTVLTIELLMHLDRSGKNHTALSKETVGLRNFKSKSTHVNSSHENMLKYRMQNLKLQ
jgi:hypothetical protein